MIHSWLCSFTGREYWHLQRHQHSCTRPRCSWLWPPCRSLPAQSNPPPRPSRSRRPHLRSPYPRFTSRRRRHCLIKCPMPAPVTTGVDAPRTICDATSQVSLWEPEGDTGFHNGGQHASKSYPLLETILLDALGGWCDPIVVPGIPIPGATDGREEEEQAGLP